MKNLFHYYNTKIGDITIIEEDEKIITLTIDIISPSAETQFNETPLIKMMYDQLIEYLNGERYEFTVPIRMEGTEFQRSVWCGLMEIPYGETRSYKDVAVQIGHPRAYRAVGNANHNNSLLIIVPCHRVIQADGTIGGYGEHIEIKEMLLELEKNHMPR